MKKMSQNTDPNQPLNQDAMKDKIFKESQEVLNQLIDNPPETREFVKQCWEIYKFVLRRYRYDVAEEIVNSINESVGYLLTEDSKKNSVKPRQLIIPMYVRSGDQRYIEETVSTIKNKINTFYEPQNEGEQTKNIRMYTEPFTKMSQVGDYLKKKMPQWKNQRMLNIYISDRLTDLSLSNLGELAQKLKGAEYVIVAPTSFNLFGQIQQENNKLNVLPTHLMLHKQLFCQFFFECICSKSTLAYLPKQSLKLIEQFSYSPITYKQASHRLIYLIQRLEIMRNKKQVQFQYVEIKKLFKAIKKDLFRQVFFFNKNQDIEEYIKIIIDNNQKVGFPSKYVGEMMFHLNQQQRGLTKQEMIKKVRNIFIENLEKQEELKHLCKFFKNKKQQTPKKNRSNTKKIQNQQDQLISPEKKLENEVRDMIEFATQKIRKQAEMFSWEQFHFIQRIKSVLPYSIFDSLAQLSRIHHNLLQYIYQKPNMPMTQLLQRFCVQGTMDAEDLNSYIRDLELQGMIEIKKVENKTLIQSLFYQEPSPRKGVKA